MEQREVKRTDARHLSAEEKFRIRQAIANCLASGMSGKETARMLGTGETTVSNVKRTLQSEGIAGISMHKVGRHALADRLLSNEQELKVFFTVLENTPDRCSLGSSIWSREVVNSLIKRECGIELKESTLGCYMKRCGLISHRIIKHQEKRAGNWRAGDNIILASGQTEKSRILFFDSKTEFNKEREYINCLIGKTGQSEKYKLPEAVTMLSVLTNRGKLYFVLYKSKADKECSIDFLCRLIDVSAKKILLITGKESGFNLRGKENWLTENKDRIEILV